MHNVRKKRESNLFPQPMIMVHHQLNVNHQCANIIKYIWLLIQVHTLSHSLTYTGAARLWFTFFFNCSRCFDIFFCASLSLSLSRNDSICNVMTIISLRVRMDGVLVRGHPRTSHHTTPHLNLINTVQFLFDSSYFFCVKNQEHTIATNQ